MTYYYPPGAQVAAIPTAVNDKPGIYGAYNGHIHAAPVPVPRQSAMAGAPIIQQGPHMPQPGGPPHNMGLTGASPLTNPSPLAAATPGASPLQHGPSSLPPVHSPYQTSITSTAPTFMSALPSGMYATSAPGLYQGATLAYPQQTHTMAPSVHQHPQTMATNPYMGRPIQPYAAATMVPHSAAIPTQGTHIHTVPMVPTSQMAGYPGLAQAPPPIFSSPHAGYGMGQMPTFVYASPSQAPPQMPGTLSSPYPHAAMLQAQGLAGQPPGASYPRAPNMP